MQDIGLADRYPVEYHKQVSNCLLGIHGSRDDAICTMFVTWARQFGTDVEALYAALQDTALGKAVTIRLCYGSYMDRDLNIDSLASMFYLRKHFGDRTETLLTYLEARTVWIYDDAQDLDPDSPINKIIKGVVMARLVEQAAHAYSLLEIMRIYDFSVGHEYLFMNEHRFTVILALTVHCLNHNVGLETVWDNPGLLSIGPWLSENEQFWGDIITTDREQTEPLMLHMFTRQQVLYAFLLQTPREYLEQMRDRHPDIADLLGSYNLDSIPGMVYIAGMWKNNLLLDLLDIYMDPQPIKDLALPKQTIVNQSLSIEI